MAIPASPESLPRFNPTLVLEGRFVTLVDGQPWTTSFRLAQEAAITRWLLTFAEFFLARQRRIDGGPAIGEPPAGDNRQALIKGRVILAEQRPDGGLGLKLNPNLGIWLGLSMRIRNEPARQILVALHEQPELVRWLLIHQLAGVSAADIARLDAGLRASLCEQGVLVSEMPPADAHLPDPGLPADLASELATATRLYQQPAGAEVPTEVRRTLGNWVSALPPGMDLIWGEDAGTGIFYPSHSQSGPGLTDIPPVQGAAAAERAAFWDRQRQSARQSIRSRRYAVLRQIIPAAQQTKLALFARELLGRGYFPPMGSDGWFERRTILQSPPGLSGLHAGLSALLSDVCGEPLTPSFCQLGVYEAGAVLDKHKDRPQCIYNLSLVIDMKSEDGNPQPWPIYLEVDGRPEAADLQVGDGVVYPGTEIWHWRDALPAGQRATVFFLFFVPPDFSGTLD